MAITLTLTELGLIVLGAVVLASTDAAALSRLGVTWLSKKLAVSPTEIYRTSEATDGTEPDDAPDAGDQPPDDQTSE